MTQSLSLSAPASSLPAEKQVAPQAEFVLQIVWRISVGILVLLLLIVATLVYLGDLYTPGSTVGYNLGLAGGLMMLTLLLYSLRKRFRALDRLGAMNSWFRFHMFIGIAGPMLVVFHSTFSLKSMNGTVAFMSMLLVVLSGVVGRFIYRHIHRGLYGRKLTVSATLGDIRTSIERLSSVFSLQADIEPRLRAFQEFALAPSSSFFAGMRKFITLHSRARSLSNEIRSEIRPALVQRGTDMRLSRSQIILEYKIAKEHINTYLDAIVKAAQLSRWERAFSLWHLVHIPFLYLLIISGIVHVIAVHMY